MQEWTEEDQDKLIADRRNWTLAMIKKVRDDAQKRYDTQYENYQSTGTPAAERAMRKWEDLIDICQIAHDSLSQECVRCDLRWKNGKAIADHLSNRKLVGENTISIDEAIGLILDVAAR